MSRRQHLTVSGANLLFALALPVVSFLFFPQGEIGNAAEDPEIVPAAYAFLIWGPIYGLMILMTAAQLFRPKAYDDRLLAPVFAALLATNAWLVAAFAQSMLALTLVCMVAIASALVVAFTRVRLLNLRGREWAMRNLPLSLFIGWITVVTFANTAVVLKPLGAHDPLLSWICLSAAAFAGVLLTTRSRGDVACVATLLWAMIGVYAGADFAITKILSLLAAIAFIATAARSRLRSRSWPHAHSA